MNIEPPPLPLSAEESRPSAFPRQASLVCLMAPLIIIALSLFIKSFSANHQDASGRALFMVFGLVVGGFFVVGVLFGFLAIVLAKSGERRSVVVRALCGLAMLGLLVAIAVPNFMRARAQALRRKQSLQELNHAVA